MLLQVDEDISVGVDAFSRIAPAIPIIADVIISENLFEVLVASTEGRLYYVVYDKYLTGLERYYSSTLQMYVPRMHGMNMHKRREEKR